MPDRIARVTVMSVHPQFGGWTLWLRADGAAAAFKVARGAKTAARHEVKVTEAELQRLETMLEESKFWDLPPPSLVNSPMPDETWIEISAKAQSGIQASVGKFTRQKSVKFDPLQRELEAIAARAWASPKISEGPHDPYGAPPGF